MKTRVGAYLSLPLATAAVLAGPVAVAQSVLEEVTVSAQRRDQLVSDVGISVTAFSGDQLRELGLSSSMDLDNQTPGLIVTGYAKSITVFNIRGAGQLDFNDQQESPVAVYLDDVYISYLSGVGFNFFDVDHVEVLRGAQGTLFGRNATAGVVHVVSNKPTRTPEGYLELSGGEFGEIKAESAVSGPLTDALAGRLSLYYENNDGYVRNVGTVNGDAYDVNNLSGRGQLSFEPSEALSINLSARWSSDDSNSESFHIRPSYVNADGMYAYADPATHLAWCAANIPGGAAVLGSTNCYGFTDNDPRTVNNDYKTFYKRDHYGFTANINFDVGPGRITSITDWQDLDKEYRGDSDTSPQALFHFFQDFTSNQLSQELRYAVDTDTTNFTAGVYFLNIDSSGRAGVDGIGALGVGIENRYRLETTSYAAFGQLEFDLSSQFTGIVGLRWTEDEKKYSFSPRCTFQPLLIGLDAANCGIFLPFVQGEALPETKISEGNWSGSLELDWRPNDDVMVYGKVSRGYKAGGVNGGIVSFFMLDELTYGAEKPLMYEVGTKASFADDKVRLQTSVFHIDYKDFQTFTSRPGIGLVNFNNDAKIVGSEIELMMNPWKGWDFIAGVSLLDAKTIDLVGAGGQYDRKMANAPDYTFNLLGRYEWPAFGGMLAAQVDMNYVGERALEAENHPALNGAAYDVWNAHVQWTSPSEKMQLKVWIKNFTDEEYFPMSFNQTGALGMTQHVVAEPRWAGATVTFRW